MPVLGTEATATGVVGASFDLQMIPSGNRDGQILLQILEHLLCRYRFNFFQRAVVSGKEHQVLPR